MRAVALLLGLAGLAGCTSAGSADPAGDTASETVAPPAGGNWPVFRGNPLATGVADGTLPERLGLLWTFSDKDGGFEAGAAIVDGVVFAGSLGGNLYAVNLADGREKWRFHTELGFTASPAVRDGTVFVGDSDGRFHAIDAATGREKWHFDTEAEINSSANFHKSRVLFGSQDATLYCLDADSGKLVWKYRERGPDSLLADRRRRSRVRGRMRRQAARHRPGGGEGGRRRAAGRPDRLHARRVGRPPLRRHRGQDLLRDRLEASPSGVAIHRPGQESSVPFVGGRDAGGGAGRLARQMPARDRSAEPARALWQFTTRGRVDSSPVVVGGRVFFGSADGRLYAVDVASGKEVWKFEGGGSFTASPAVAAGRLVIGTDDGNLYCFGQEKP